MHTVPHLFNSNVAFFSSRVLVATRNQHSFFFFSSVVIHQCPSLGTHKQENVPAPQVPFMTPPQTPAPPPPQAVQPAPAQAPQPQAAQPQANDNVQANAGPLFDDEEDEDNANRDWLDKVYTLCRIGVLLSIFLFYSSTSCFLLLVLTFVLIYLYQCGFLEIEVGIFIHLLFYDFYLFPFFRPFHSILFTSLFLHLNWTY